LGFSIKIKTEKNTKRKIKIKLIYHSMNLLLEKKDEKLRKVGAKQF